MTFQEKLRRLAPTVNRSKVSREVGLKVNTISTYVAKGSLPRLDIALKMARALDVPLDWLADDEKPWPPPQPTDPMMLTDAKLIQELAKRFVLAVSDFNAEVAKAKAIDWSRAIAQAKATAPDGELPAYARGAMNVVGSIQVKFMRIVQDFDGEFYIRLHASELPVGPGHVDDFSLSAVVERYVEIKKSPLIVQFAEAAREKLQWQASPLKGLSDHYERQAMAHAEAVAAKPGRRAI